jgi:hypothetical protein
VTDNLVARSDLAYHALFGGTAELRGNDWWANAGPVPAGFARADPRFLDERAGELANEPGGLLRLSGGAAIPVRSVGPAGNPPCGDGEARFAPAEGPAAPRTWDARPR